MFNMKTTPETVDQHTLTSSSSSSLSKIWSREVASIFTTLSLKTSMPCGFEGNSYTEGGGDGMGRGGGGGGSPLLKHLNNTTLTSSMLSPLSPFTC